MKSKEFEELIDKITNIGKKLTESCTDETGWFDEDAFNLIMDEFCENISKMVDIFDPIQNRSDPNFTRQVIISDIDSLCEFENVRYMLPKLLVAMTEGRQDVIDEIETILDKI